MKKNQMKFLVASLAIVGAVAYLITAGVSTSSQYYLTVEELLKKDSSIYGQGLRLEGQVIEGSIKRDDDKMTVVFNMGKDLSFVPVTYTGVIPDMFKDDTKVVVEGQLTTTGVFKANTLMTSCPSKYEAMKSEQEAS